MTYCIKYAETYKLYLHEFDRAFHEGKDSPYQFANARLVRYADDFVVLARWMGSRITTWIENRLEGNLELTISRDKTSIVQMTKGGQELNFLGYTLRYDRDLHGRNTKYLNIFPGKKAVMQVRDEIRRKTGTGANGGASLFEKVKVFMLVSSGMDWFTFKSKV